MVKTISISENITLKELREKFNLQRTDERDFFTEWFENLPDLTNSDQQFLDRVKNRYFYLLDDGSLLEEGVKMMIVSPLLEVAGFYDPPFKTRFEPAVQIAVDDREEILRGRIDALIVQNLLWIWLIEAKRTTFSLGLGIPQALAYMLGNPDAEKPTFGILTSSDDFIFIKLIKQDMPVYALSKKFSILNDGELYDVLRVMRRIGRLITQE